MSVLTIRQVLLLFILINTTLWSQDNTTVVKKVTNKKIDSLLVSAVSSIETADYKAAARSLLNAKELATTIDNKKRVGHTSYTLALLYFQAKDFEQAIKENNLAILVQREDKDIRGLGLSYMLAAQIYIQQGNYKQAETFLNDGEKMIEDENLQFLNARLYLNKGNIALAANTLESALVNYARALETTSSQEAYLQADIYLKKAKAHHQAQQYTETAQALTRAQELSQQHNYPIILLEIHKIRSDIAQAQNDYQSAFESLQSYHTTKEQLDLSTQTDPLTAQNFSNTALMNQLNEEITQQSTTVTTLTTVLAMALVTVLLLLILSLYKNNNLRAKANELLQAKNTELIIAKENAEKASMVKAQFLSTITHELRTPMYAVTGLTHLLLTENPTAEQKKHLDSLKFSGEYLLSLINNILDLNKLEANKVDLEETSFNLRKRIEDVLFALEKSAKDKGNKLNFEFDEDIPVELLGDPLVISQILINLVGNAVKFTRDGDVFVRVQKISQNDAEIDLHFEIEDTGEGISKKKQKSIFQKLHSRFGSH